jgi:endonuclease III
MKEDKNAVLIDNREKLINKVLIEYSKKLNIKDLCPAKEEGAIELIITNPYAFCIAMCLDRGTPTEIIWTIPYNIYRILGHLDPERLYSYTFEDWERLIEQLKYKPRFKTAARRTLYELTKLIVEKYYGNAAKIWEEKTAIEVIKTFDKIYGVGPGIANMAVLLIEKAFNIQFLDKENINIKADTHTVMIMYRLGLIKELNEKLAVKKAKELNPSFPGIIDQPLWHIGKHFCFKKEPKCNECPLNQYCEKQGV